MPKWFHHRSIAKIFSLQLSEKEMKDIDSALDGIRKDYEHDFWKYDEPSLKKYLEEAYGLYGDDGLKYCLLHILLDNLQAFIVREKTRETVGARIMRSHAREIAFRDAVRMMELQVKDSLQEHNAIFEQFLREVESKEKEILGIVSELPEVEAQVTGIEKFKQKRKRAEEIARRYGAYGPLLPLYTSFILELWNDRKRGMLTKEAWANKVLEKHKEKLKGLNKDSSEKIYNDFVNIAKRLAYIS
ncbi:MAG: hypothetical protein QXO94_02485 [Candidatus Bathyarchaeia archaeon]